MDHNTALIWTIAAIVALALVVVAAVAATRHAQARRAELRGQFGPEYDRAVLKYGSPAKAERELAKRARRVDHFRFRELSHADRARFANRWSAVQAQFVDAPQVAVSNANGLINEVMMARGYPSHDYDERITDLSVHHASVVQHYRAAYALASGGNTEDMRQALVHYRALFAELLAPPPPHDLGATLRHKHA